MKQTTWLITTASEERFFAARVRVGEPFMSPDFGDPMSAEDLATHLVENSVGVAKIILALRSDEVLASTFTYDGPSMARQAQTMAYAVEESFPLLAEDFLADFVTHQYEALGIVAEFDWLKPFFEATHARGVVIVAVVPQVLLALQHLVQTTSADGIIWDIDNRIEFLHICDHKPIAWRSLPADSTTASAEFEMLLDRVLESNENPEVLFVRQDDPREFAATFGYENGSFFQCSFDDLVCSGALAIFQERTSPLVNLGRDERVGSLHRPLRRHVQTLVAAFCLLCLLALATLNIRASQYESVANDKQDELRQLFQDTFPGKRVPRGLRSRFENEYEKLAGSTGQLSDVPRLTCALTLLYETYARLPKDLRYRIVEIRIDNNQVYLEGQVRQHGDADLISTALRRGGFDVTPPRTETLPGRGVNVTISARSDPGNDAARIAEVKE